MSETGWEWRVFWQVPVEHSATHSGGTTGPSASETNPVPAATHEESAPVSVLWVNSCSEQVQAAFLSATEGRDASTGWHKGQMMFEPHRNGEMRCDVYADVGDPTVGFKLRGVRDRPVKSRGKNRQAVSQKAAETISDESSGTLPQSAQPRESGDGPPVGAVEQGRLELKVRREQRNGGLELWDKVVSQERLRVWDKGVAGAPWLESVLLSERPSPIADPWYRIPPNGPWDAVPSMKPEDLWVGLKVDKARTQVRTTPQGALGTQIYGSRDVEVKIETAEMLISIAGPKASASNLAKLDPTRSDADGEGATALSDPRMHPPKTSASQRWRSVCVEGPSEDAVRAIVESSPFISCWVGAASADGVAKQNCFVGGYPALLRHIVLDVHGTPDVPKKKDTPCVII